jgi:hypothetical protein
MWYCVKHFSYLCTYDLNGPVRNVFDACRYITSFLGPKWHRLSARCHFTGPNNLSIFSRARPPPTCQEMDVPASKAFAQGCINHRCIGVFYVQHSKKFWNVKINICMLHGGHLQICFSEFPF